MKTKYFYGVKNISKMTFVFFLTSIVFFSSCKKDSIDTGHGQPYFEIKDFVTSLDVSSGGGITSFSVYSNRPWEVVQENEVDWVTIEDAEGNGDGSFKITVGKNNADARTMNLAFIVDGEQLDDFFKVSQEEFIDEPIEEGKVVFNEDFSWLSYGSAVFYTTTDEKRFDLWTEDEKAKGWTSTINPVEGSGGQPLVYARQGFVKLGKTSYGGDFISPKLAEIDGTQNVLVKFKAVPYQTKGGARDGTILKVNVIGPGTINTAEFNIDNWPDYTADPTSTEIWKASETERSFTITGATAETQIRFLGQDFDLRVPVDPNKNRIFLDDIEVTVKK